MDAQVLSFDDTIQYTSDSSSSSDESDVDDETVLDPSIGQGAGKRTSWLKRLATPSSRKELSIQSGDIIRSPTPTSPSGNPAVAVVSPPMPPQARGHTEDTTAAAQAVEGNGYVNPSETEAASLPPNGTFHPLSSESMSKPKGGCYGAVFPILHNIIQYAFFSISIPIGKTKIDVPLLSIIKLVANFLLMTIILAVSLTKYPPRINMSIESFGVPSHPAQVHWDAFEAAKDNQFIIANTSLPPINTNALRRRRDTPNTLQTGSAEYPDCPPSSSTQYALHLNWEMDLIFRVPEGVHEDDNILSRDRIAYIHKVEELIYNSTEYKHFCHKRSSSNLCDPLNSILTWLYPRDPKTGMYVYDTPDGFTPDLSSTIRSLSANLSVALWFTGGEVNFVNSSYVEAKLLRSQIRVGLPLPCFTGTQDRKEKQKAFVTRYFVSLMSVFDELSTR